MIEAEPRKILLTTRTGGLLFPETTEPPETPMAEPYTKEEMRQMFLDQLQSIASYWSQLGDITPREMCDGVVFSILNVFDGCSGGFPCAINLVMEPHPEDKAYHISRAVNWVEPGQVINDDVMLHELFVKPLRKMNESTPKPTDNLPSAAQAVLHEFWNAPVSPARNVQIAAAIRALADQVVPEIDLFISVAKWSARYETRRELLAIAAELEGSI
jgi:hypothetical protein